MQNSLFTKLKAFLLLLGSNPIVAWLVRQGTTQAVAYYTTDPFTPLAWQKWLLNGVVFVVAGTVHAFDLWLQSQVANAPQPTPVPAPAPAPTPAVTTHLTRLKAMLKVLVAGLLLAALAGPSWAGYLMTAPKGELTGLTLPSGTALYLMPIEGFDVGASLPKPTYGLSVNEDLVWGTMATLDGSPNLVPILGVGASIYADAAGPINGSGPLKVLGGFNAVGPDLDLLGLGNGQGLVPQGLMTWNFVTGEKVVTGGLTVFADLFPGTATKVTP